MKKILLPAAALAMFLAACQNAPTADNATTGDAQEVTAAEGTSLKADVNQSKIEFVGTKRIGSHNGTMQLKEGEVIVAGSDITGGKFVIDMNTVQTHDQDEKGNAKLTGHLKSADFFDVENHPEAIFEIVSVVPGVENPEELILKDATHTITGNLTIKGITNSITFPAKVHVGDNQVHATANFNIDRTKWDIVYGNDQSLGDSFILPEVNIQLELVAGN